MASVNSSDPNPNSLTVEAQKLLDSLKEFVESLSAHLPSGQHEEKHTIQNETEIDSVKVDIIVEPVLSVPHDSLSV